MGEKEQCCICGKQLDPMRSPRLTVNYDRAHSRPIDLDDEPAHGTWGFLPIGSGCAKMVGIATWNVHERKEEPIHGA